MQATYTKADLLTLEDRYENIFSLSHETSELPDMLIEMEEASYSSMRSNLISENYSLIVCLPRLPVFKVLKKAELLNENHSFRLIRISAENYNSAIEYFLTESEYLFTFFWLKDFQEVVYVLPRTSQERIKLYNLRGNRLYSFWIEAEECTVAAWD